MYCLWEYTWYFIFLLPFFQLSYLSISSSPPFSHFFIFTIPFHFHIFVRTCVCARVRMCIYIQIFIFQSGSCMGEKICLICLVKGIGIFYCMCTTCVQCSWRPWKSIRFSWNWRSYRCLWAAMCFWVPRLDPLERQQGLLAAKSFLQLHVWNILLHLIISSSVHFFFWKFITFILPSVICYLMFSW